MSKETMLEHWNKKLRPQDNLYGQDQEDDVDPFPREIPWKYNEPKLLEDLKDYLAGTYKAHYVGDDNVQAMDLIISTGRAQDFCLSNIIKYAARCGRKGNPREDMLKIIHYALFAMYDYDKKSSTI